MIQLHGDTAGATLWLVTARGIILSLVLLGIAVWNQSAPLAAMAALILALAGVTRLWSLLALHSVRCTLEFKDDRAFPDDEVDLVMRVRSRGPVPIAWLEVDFTVPRGLYATPEPGLGVLSGDGRALHLLVTLMPLRTVERTIRVRCRQRGVYEVGSVGLLVADPLRLYPRRLERPTEAKLLVFPRVVPLEQIGLRAGLAIGDIRAPTFVLPDPVRPIGVRDYRPGDSPRQIHWKASARRGSIQVKVLERTVRRDLAIYLDVGGFDHSWLVYREALFERAVTAAASLANATIERGGSVALACGGSDPIALPGNTGLDQLRGILEALAVVQPTEGRPIENMIAATLWRQPAGTTIVVLTPTPEEPLLAELAPVRRRGDPVAIVYCGLRQAEPPEGIAWFDLGRERDVITALAAERRS
ncbi:MAG TPA: DUF58 domain-containing protein [Chloroflexota bacterium]|nr:DUF58 domain-containing protein [Chloroflexota bacterium]